MRIATILALLATLFFSSATIADPVTIASASQGSSTYSMALAISDAVSKASGMDMRPQPYKSTSQARGFVYTAEVNFGPENASAIRRAIRGDGQS